MFSDTRFQGVYPLYPYPPPKSVITTTSYPRKNPRRSSPIRPQDPMFHRTSTDKMIDQIYPTRHSSVLG